MKSCILLVVNCLLIATSVSAQQGNRKNVFPTKSQFNAESTKALLDYGEVTINGVAFTREYTDANSLNNFLGVNVVGKKHLAAEGTKIVLFPVTAYFEEYLKLRKKYKRSKKYRAMLSQEAFSHRIEVSVGTEGKFTFNEMKPGKYYLEALIKFNGTDIASKQVGRSDYYNGFGHYRGSSPIYEHYVLNYNGAHLETKIIEVKEGDSVIDIKL
ncbi:hypothetical protein MQE36_05380 [Zhouia spongiae]|uniref:Carboxypeptidase regulatory-like domain-containing protein n=1 Tax=Zhouia spongiae TaxID=2202721 RepID=A0ABY3YQ01_9FLAO|nr:hypothetical protein [Zhouia spongiae]UNY99776.1 hypothetical protein MQE36_05380 [Zhouia spongiae]